MEKIQELEESNPVDWTKKVPLLLFSGGLDSTYMLQTYLEKGDVEVLYVTASQGDEKVAKELEAREKIILVLQDITGNRVRRTHHVEMGRIFDGGVADKGFLQAPAWIVGALQVSDHNVHSELAIGYVAGDQIACKIPYIQNVWDNIQTFVKHGSIPVVFPLQLLRKLHILDNIYPEIVQHVWVCEMPLWWKDGKEILHGRAGGQLKSCGKCDACITQAGTMAMWKQLHGVPYSTTWITRLNLRKNNPVQSLEKEIRKEDDS